MQITGISSLVVNARMRNWIFVKVETSEPGLWGWGEATLEWKTKGVTGAIEDLSVLLIGQNPLRIEHLWQTMHRQYFWRDGITGMSAISGIDQALWDIKGKEAGKPVCELLGGPVRDTLRYYDHLGGGTLEGMYGTSDPEHFAEGVRRSMERGFTAVKAMPIPVAELIESPGTLKHSARCVEAMRLAAGDKCDIMLDLHARTTPAAAIQFGRMLAELQPLLVRRAVLAGTCGRFSRGCPRAAVSHRHGRAVGHPLGVPRTLRKARLRHPAARCLALRRHQRSSTDCRPGGNLPDVGGVPQSAGTGCRRRHCASCIRYSQLLNPGGSAQRRPLAG